MAHRWQGLRVTGLEPPDRVVGEAAAPLRTPEMSLLMEPTL